MFRHDLRTRSSWAILPFLVSLAIVFAATGCDQGEPGKSAPPVQTPGDTPKDAIFAIFKEARDRAKKEDKLVMVELYDEACQYCETMEGETLSDDSVVEALKDFVQVQITPKHKSLIKAFELRISPAFVFLKPDKHHLKPPLQGFRSTEVFLAELRNYRLRARGKEPLPVPEDPHPDYGKG